MSLLRALMWTLALALLAGAAVLWPQVPDRIPTHFGAGGQPDAWGPRSLAVWFGLPLVALALAAVIEGSARWVRTRPESPMVNLPRKAEVLALPEEPRARALALTAAACTRAAPWPCWRYS